MEKGQIKNLLKSTYKKETRSDNLENLNMSELKLVVKRLISNLEILLNTEVKKQTRFKTYEEYKQKEREIILSGNGVEYLLKYQNLKKIYSEI